MQWLPCSATIHGSAVATARFGHSAVCISETGSVWGTDLVVVFGGVSYSDGDSALGDHAALSDVVVLQAEADMWFAPQVSAAADGGLPEARAFHCAAAIDRRMYVFGGHVMSYDPVLNKKRRRFFNDLWCLDTDTWTWQCLSPGVGSPGALPGAAGEAPSRRDMATLTRAGSGCLLLFGGRLESGRVAGDAWVLDVNTNTWSHLRLPGPTPPPRKMHAAVYVSCRVVIFGGERDAGLLDDLWTLKGADGAEAAKWTQIKLRPAPSGRFGHAIEACGSRLAVFGGCLDQSTLLSFSRTYVQCNELWVLDMATFSWHRVEVPEGVVTFSGPALDDPHLLPLLQQQAAEPAEQRPPSQQLLALPLERMCHSLVMVGPPPPATPPPAATATAVAGAAPGPGGRLLLLGGRKRDGICDDSWWLTMGPDNLTPSLTVPPPESLATALAASRANRPAQPRGPAPSQQPPAVPGAPGAAAAAVPSRGAAPFSSPQTPPAPPPLVPLPAAPPALANPTLLSNLLRKSAPPAPAPAPAAPQPALAGAAVAGSGGGAAGGSFNSSSSGSALDAAASSALVPIPSGPTGPAGGQVQGAAATGAGAGFEFRGMPASKSTGSIMHEPGSAVAASASAAAAAAPGLAVLPLGGGFTGGPQHSQQQGQGQGQVPPGAVGKERMADKASMAITRLMSNLRQKDGGGGGGGGAPAPPPAVSPSTSPTGGGMGLIARFLDGRGGGGGGGGGGSAAAAGAAAAAAATAAAATSPAVTLPSGRSSSQGQAGAVTPGTDMAGGKFPPASPPGLAASLPPEVRDPLDRLRAGVGLAPLGAPPDVSPAPSYSCTDPRAALSALGRRLAAATAAESGRSHATVAAPSPVWLARQHLAACAPERLSMGQLGLVLADCQALLKDRIAVAWGRLEGDERPAQRRQDSSGDDHSGGGAVAADTATLTWLVASRSHWLMGLRPEELRMGDVVRLMQSYGELLAEAVSSGGAAVGTAG